MFTKIKIEKMDTANIYNNAHSIGIILQNMPNTFSTALVYLMDEQHYTIEELSEYSGISTSTIKRLRTIEPSSLNKDTVIRLCVGMKLDPLISGEFIRRSPNRLLFSERDILYKELLMLCPIMSAEECEETLQYIEHI